MITDLLTCHVTVDYCCPIVLATPDVKICSQLSETLVADNITFTLKLNYCKQYKLA